MKKVIFTEEQLQTIVEKELSELLKKKEFVNQIAKQIVLTIIKEQEKQLLTD